MRINLKRWRLTGIVIVTALLLIATVKKFIPQNISGVAHVLNLNRISVTTNNDLDSDLIIIDLSIQGTRHINKAIFHGGTKQSIPKGYGENDWYLSYNDSLFTVFRHFKTNNWHDHDYHFHFYKSDDKTLCDVNIAGPDPLNQTIAIVNSQKEHVGDL